MGGEPGGSGEGRWGAPPEGARCAARGDARVGSACTGASACHGRLALRESETYERGGRPRRRTLELGSVSYSLAAGRRETVDIRLDADGRRALRAGRGRLPFQLAIVQSAPAPAVGSVKDVVLVAAEPRQARHG